MDQIAKDKFAIKVLSYADYETHELPWGFLGEEPHQTLAEVIEAIKYLEGSLNEKSRMVRLTRLREIQERLKSYLDSRQ